MAALHPVLDAIDWQLALSALADERAAALPALERLHADRERAGDRAGSALCAHAALALCVLDMGAMETVQSWIARAGAAAPQGTEPFAEQLWWRLGSVARGVLADAAGPAATLAATWLQAQLRAQCASPDERLLIALVLVNHHLAERRYEQFEALASLVRSPETWRAAQPLMRARWLHSAGYAHHQVGHGDRAERDWQAALLLARDSGATQLALQNTLALVRAMLDDGRLAEAGAQLDAVLPDWGAGRSAQLIDLQQMRARRELLSGQPARALAHIDDALALADEAQWPDAERSACLTDRVQVWIALRREDDALAELARLRDSRQGRDRAIFASLHDLLAGWLRRGDDEAAARELLRRGLQAALAQRYTMFFRLLPQLAAQMSALALRLDVEAVFVAEVIQARRLAAPAEADERWPWPLWLRLLGTFDCRLSGVRQEAQGKTQHKPLELLRRLACTRELHAPMTLLQDQLWPDADAPAARKNLEMAVQRLRRLLSDDSLVRVADGRVALDAARCSSDVQQRRALLERIESLAMSAPTRARPAESITARLAALVEAFARSSGGELLPDAPSTPWLEAEREACRRETVRATSAARGLLERLGDEGPLARQILVRLRERS